MCIYTHVPRSATQTLLLSIRNMLFRLWIPILLRHSEIDHIYYTRGVWIIRRMIFQNTVWILKNSGNSSNNAILPVEPAAASSECLGMRPVRKLSGFISL